MRSKLLIIVLLLKLSDLSGQVPVHQEPRHHPVFQNEAIRILNVLLPPGDTSEYHVHTTPSLFIRLSGTVTGSQLQGGKAASGKSVAGTLLFENLAPPHIRTHRVWNADADTFHVMDVELLFKDSGFAQSPLISTGLTLEIDTPWVRAYRLNLLNGTDFLPENRNKPFMLISFDAASVQIKQNGNTKTLALKAGSFIEIKSKRSFSLKNVSGKTVQFVLLEFPVQ